MTTHLITGAGSGIGAAIANALHARGDRLVLIARSASRGAELATRWPGSAIVVADLNTPQVAAQVLADASLPEELDSVVHSAGIGGMGPVSDMEPDAFTAVLAVNLVSPAVVTKACLPAVRRAGGVVIFINSGAGLNSGPGWSPYSASKFGLKALADSLRAEEQANGVRVTTIYPGRTATPMQEALHEWEGVDYDASRWIQPETVATAVLQVIDLTPDAAIPDLSIRPRTI